MPDTPAEDRGDTPSEEQLAEAARKRDELGRFKKAEAKKAAKEAAAADGEVGEGEDVEEVEEEEEEETPTPKAKPKPKKKTDREEVEETDEEETEAPAAEDEEEETEAAAADEDEDEDEEETDEDAKLAGKMVTLKRFKEVIKQRRELQAKLEDQKAAEKKVDSGETAAEKQLKAFNARLDELYIKVEEARLAEDPKLAAQLQREIDGMNRQIANAEAAVTARREAFTVQQNGTYNQMLDYLETVRPIIDPEAPEFDKRVVKELTFHVKAYEGMGMPPTDALRKACQMIFENDPFVPNVKKALKDDEVKPTVKKTDVAKNVAAKKKTPPTPGRTQEGSGKINPARLSDEEFDKLPDSKKREMRGDVM